MILPYAVGAGTADRVLRRERLTAWQIAERLGMPLSTCRRSSRIGLGGLSQLEPPEPPNRYQRGRPGELIHIDVKRLARIGRPGHRVNVGRADPFAESSIATQRNGGRWRTPAASR